MSVASKPHETQHGSAAPALAAALVSLLLFTALAARVAADGEVGEERELVHLSERLYEVETAWAATKASLYLSIAAGGLLAVAVLGLLLARRRRWEAAFWALAVGGVLVLDPALKALVGRPGIGNASDEYSFPSGHAAASLAILIAAVLLLGRSDRRGLVAVLGAAAVALEGVGLVMLGWHYASDVAAGWCIAVAWVTLLWLAFSRYPRPAS